MSESCNQCGPSIGDKEAADVDRRNGLRMRRFNRTFDTLAEKYDLDPTAVRLFIRQAGLPPYYSGIEGGMKVKITEWLDESKHQLATAIGVDWEGLIDFMNALMPIIEEFMAMCAV